MKRVVNLVLPFCGVALALSAWWAASVAVADLPSPLRTWDESKLYILEPLAKRGESDQGILLLAYFIIGKNDSVGIISNLFPMFVALYNVSVHLRHREQDKAGGAAA